MTSFAHDSRCLSSWCDDEVRVAIHCDAAVMRDVFVLNLDEMQATECKLLRMVGGRCDEDADGWA